MVFPTWRRLLAMALVLGLSPLALAEPALQRQKLAAAVRQIDALERLVRQSETNTPVAAGERYHFDYPRLLSDLVQVRTGIQSYLAPSRAQPRDLAELSGDYRSEAVTNEAEQP